MNNIKVSIIIPVYNSEKYLRQCLDSVINQTFKDIEIIVINDGSTDNSLQIIQEYVNKYSNIKLINKQNEGCYKARNIGLETATGEYIAFLDADDIWRPEKLKKTLDFMTKKGAAFAFTAYDYGDKNANSLGKTVHVPEIMPYEKALSRTVIFTSTVMFDTEKIDMEIIHMPQVPSEDTATWWRILKSGYVAYGLDENLAIYRRPGKSLSSNKLVAIERIWFLYRNIADLSVIKSFYYFVGWAVRATLRRL